MGGVYVETIEKHICPQCGNEMSYFVNPWSHEKEWYCEHCDME